MHRHPPVPLLAEGERWVVVSKPPRVVVHRGPRMRRASAMLQRVRDMLGRRVFLVHRLDRQTSGCLLLATDSEMAGQLSAALSAAESHKTYLAFVRGAWAHDGVQTVRSSILTEQGLKEAVSHIEGLGASEDPRCSLLRVFPETGRHHQVRRHVRDLHHPIIHDGEHGDSRVNRLWREQHGVQRLGLHCLRLKLPLPDGSELDVTSPLWADQAELWRSLPWWDRAVAAEPALALPPLSMDRVVLEA
ncbi:MAG: pseudouridylate synthase [Alphaproteobacteria bacterium]|nr:pseudouridylate synthase [Alphaproteobacteria bacterium]